MTKTTEQALDTILQVADRAVQRGNIFTSVAEVASFISAYNTITATLQTPVRQDPNGEAKKQEAQLVSKEY